jgi:arylsulfatase A-like enzyme
MFYLLEDAVDWLMDQLLVLPQPYLVYYHLLPPHNPYNTRQEFIDIFQDGWNPEPKPESYFSEGVSNQRLNANRRLYDEYIPYADAEFGRLVDFLNRKGLLDNSLVVLTSDHGEMFERGILGHNTPTLYQPLIRVPLLISRPRQTEREDVYTNTSCVDVLPTLLRAAGQPIPGWCEGAVLPPFSDKIEKDRDIYTVEAKSSPKFAPLNKATISLVKGDYKLIHYRGYGSGIPPYELYSLTNDPEERVDLYGSQKGVADEMTGILLQKLAQVNQPYEKKSAL